MGIPGLATHLKKPYAVPTVLGCKTADCELHKSQHGSPSHDIIIDGPSFAYAIYHLLIIHTTEWLTAVDAMPNYDELGRGALAFLDELESYGLNVENIYFDGYLPTHKRETRIDRLKRSLQKLASYHTVSRKEVHSKRTRDGQSLPPAAVLQSGPTLSAFRGVLPAPFIVPAVLDALSRSKYAKFTSVVPGEAEVYCASAARKNGGIILSNDSDLYVHDLGTGAFVYLDSVEMPPSKDRQQGTNSETCKLIELGLNCPRDIAKRLGLSNLRELAYQFTKGYSQTLPEAIKAAKKHQRDDQISFNGFAQEYITETFISAIKHFSPEALARLSIQSQFLDPRLSELVYQLESKDCHIAEAYLLCLIEDPCRSSAWLVSSGQRTFAYSICALPRKRKAGSENLKIEECNRRGQDFIMQEISLLTEPEIIAYANNSHKRIQTITDTFSEIPSNLTWRIHALFEVYRWYLNADRTPPARELLKSALTGVTHPHLIWQTTHLSAQIQAVLYSLRMIHQTLIYIASATAEPLPTSLRELATTLEKLPSLAQLIPSPFELASQTANLDIGSVLHRLAMMLQNEADHDGPSVINTSEELLNAPMEHSPRKKCKKSNKKKKKGAKVVPKGKPDNMFEMLM